MILPLASQERLSANFSLRSTLNWQSSGLLLSALLCVLFMGLACGDSSDMNSDVDEEGASPSVRITQPTDGVTVQGSSVLVTLQTSGLRIVPAGTFEDGTGHHHLVVNAPLPANGAPIPSTPGTHIHLGQAQTEYELTGLTSGEHSVITVVGDGAHIPLDPWIADTVTFFVP